jgi:hypothetical protein
VERVGTTLFSECLGALPPQAPRLSSTLVAHCGSWQLQGHPVFSSPQHNQPAATDMRRHLALCTHICSQVLRESRGRLEGLRENQVCREVLMSAQADHKHLPPFVHQDVEPTMVHAPCVADNSTAAHTPDTQTVNSLVCVCPVLLSCTQP